MSSVACPPSPQTRTISGEALAWLARTYDAATEAVWIHDTANDCVYRNATAGKMTPRPATHAFEVVNHSGTVIGRLHIARV